MFKKKAHWLALAHMAFVGLLAMLTFLVRNFWFCGIFWPFPMWVRVKPCWLGQINNSTTYAP